MSQAGRVQQGTIGLRYQGLAGQANAKPQTFLGLPRAMRPEFMDHDVGDSTTVRPDRRDPIMDVFDDLPKVAHVEPSAADGAVHVMIGLLLRDAIGHARRIILCCDAGTAFRPEHALTGAIRDTSARLT
jgi:hypothetical protein